jgi:hypothetical protein
LRTNGHHATSNDALDHLIPAAAISRFTSCTQFSTTTGSAAPLRAVGFTNTKFLPSRDTSKLRHEELPG